MVTPDLQAVHTLHVQLRLLEELHGLGELGELGGHQLEDTVRQEPVGGEGDLRVERQQVELHQGQQTGGVWESLLLPVVDVLQHKLQDLPLPHYGLQGEGELVSEDEQLAVKHHLYLVYGKLQEFNLFLRRGEEGGKISCQEV